MVDLAPCPFCRKEWTAIMGNGSASRWRRCQSCDSSGPPMLTENEANAAWNRRPSPWLPIPPDPVPGVVPWDGGKWDLFADGRRLIDAFWEDGRWWLPCDLWPDDPELNKIGLERTPTHYAAPLPPPPALEDGR